MGTVVGFPTGLVERFWNRGSCYMTRMLNDVDGQLYSIYILQLRHSLCHMVRISVIINK